MALQSLPLTRTFGDCRLSQRFCSCPSYSVKLKISLYGTYLPHDPRYAKTDIPQGVNMAEIISRDVSVGP